MEKILLPMFLLISLVFNAYFWTQNNKNLTVKEVLDGDTFTLFDDSRVRLLGIDAPEGDRCGSNEAKSLLTSLVLNKKVRLTDEKRDTYGRRMGLVYAKGKFVNEEMLKSGWAKANYDPNPQSELLKSANNYASDNKLGVHSELCKKVNPSPPSANCTIKGNIDKGTGQKFYHLSKCPHYNQIVLDLDIGEAFFCNEKEAEEAGFILASECGK